MAQSGPSRDSVSCVLPFYVPEDAAIAEQVIGDLESVNIRFYEEGGEGMAEGVYTTLLAFVSEASAASDGLRAAVEGANANGKGVVAVYLNGVVPDGLGGLLDFAEEFVHRPGGEDALLRKLATAHDMRACRKETLEPYEGPLDYIFVSYAHKNSADVLPVIRDLQDEGFRVWYDAGIEVGSEWDAYIMDHLERCKAFICFQSPEFRASTYCKQEIDHALEHVPGAVVVACVNPNEGVESIPEELTKFQGVLRHDCDTDKDFFEKLISAGELEPCRDVYRISADGKVLEKYLGGSAVVRVPEGVEEIGPRAIVTPNARKVIVPASVTKISEQAFIGCGLLEEVVLPDSVTEIGKEAFLGCASLRSVEIPPNIEVIEDSIFADCIALEEVGFSGEKIQDIMPHAFENCTSLTQIELPKSVKRLWRHCFAGCAALDLAIPESVDAIAGYFVYRGCKSISIDSENTAYSFRDKCLLSADGATLFSVNPDDACGSFSVPRGVVRIVRNLSDHKEPVKIKRWDEARQDFVETRELWDSNFLTGGAFFGCTFLTDVQLPDTLETIDGCAFSRCCSLVGIDIPQSVKTIGSGAFSGCISLVSISLPDGLDVLESNTFQKCKSLQEVQIPEGVQVVQIGAFRDCSSLVTVDMPNSVKVIRASAFRECESLRELILPDSLDVLESFAFKGCRLLEVRVPKNITTLESHVFDGCQSVLIDQHASSIAYNDTDGLINTADLSFIGLPFEFAGSTFKVPEGIRKIQRGALEDEDGRLPETIVIPRSVIDLGAESKHRKNLSVVKHPDFECVGYWKAAGKLKEITERGE